MISRLLAALGGKKLVRLHLSGDHPSVEGVYAGRRNGRYVLLLPSVLIAEDQTQRLEGRIEVPSWQVVFMQVLAKGR